MDIYGYPTEKPLGGAHEPPMSSGECMAGSICGSHMVASSTSTRILLSALSTPFASAWECCCGGGRVYVRSEVSLQCPPSDGMCGAGV